MLRFRSLGSGSSGNATVVEASSGVTTTRVLIDCGLGIKQLDSRLAQAGLSASDIDAIFITHEHGDHIGCAKQFAIREHVPVWMSYGTFSAVSASVFDGPEAAAFLRIARDGVPISIGDLLLNPFTVPHDAKEPLQLTCTDGLKKIGILTDLGHATPYVIRQLQNCHALLLESNHDEAMLSISRYPEFLKRRVGGLWGHLGNSAAADIAAACLHESLGRVVAAHLSEQNNRPELARASLSKALNRSEGDIDVAHPIDGTHWFEV